MNSDAMTYDVNSKGVPNSALCGRGRTQHSHDQLIPPGSDVRETESGDHGLYEYDREEGTCMAFVERHPKDGYSRTVTTHEGTERHPQHEYETEVKPRLTSKEVPQRWVDLVRVAYEDEDYSMQTALELIHFDSEYGEQMALGVAA